jgi:hypothetical protein
MALIDTLFRQKYGQLLTGNITLNGKIVPVLNKVLNGQAMPYVEILGQNATRNIANKDTFQQDINIPVKIYTNGIGGAGGDLDADLIEQQIIDRLYKLVAIAGFSISQESYTSQSFNSGSGREYQTFKVINFFYHILKN